MHVVEVDSKTGYWKVKLSDAPITKDIRVYSITPDEDGTLTIIVDVKNILDAIKEGLAYPNHVQRKQNTELQSCVHIAGQLCGCCQI